MQDLAYDVTQKSIKERVFHALLFEIIAISIVAPLFAWISGHSVEAMGALAVIIAITAMLFNMLYNFIFDKLQHVIGFERSVKIRCLHAFLFECSFVVVSIPLAVWFLSIGWIEAFFLDFSLTMFFLPYTFLFNWLYDFIREHVVTQSLQEHHS